MIPSVVLRDVITILKDEETGPADDYGNPTLVTVSTTNVPAMVWPSGIADELEIQRDTRIARYNIIVKPDEDVDGISRIQWSGITMKVEGEPFIFMARGLPHHIEMKARDIRG